MTIDELRRLWIDRRDEWRRLGVTVDGAKVADEILADLDVLDATDAQLLTLEQAATESGYSADHLGRLVRSGAIPNAGRAHAPKIRRRDLPRRAAALPSAPTVRSISSTRRRIAASVLASPTETTDG